MAAQDMAMDLEVIRRERILFLHHSVGGNILAGMDRLASEAGVSGPFLVTPEQADGLDGPVLVHGPGGRNGLPFTKIDSFAALVRGARVKPRLAVMKLCYVDFEPGTDVPALFAAYATMLEALKREYPEIRFAHMTAPLTRRPTDLKSRARRLLGLDVWEDASNARRAAYNRLLVERFPSDPIFDLAGEESGRAGTEPVAGVNGTTGLVPEYTDDGGHLNALGQRVVGAAAIRFLAEALRARGT